MLKENGAGYKFSENFGFGLIQMNAFVTEAENWQTVPKQNFCTISLPTKTSFGNKQIILKAHIDKSCYQEWHLKF